jgi:predicted Zn-dependent protease
MYIMKQFLCFFLVVLILMGTFLQGQAQQQNNVFIELQGHSWNKSTIRTLIVKAENETWWNEELVNSTLRAINQWNEAINFFSTKYADFAYLSALNLRAEVSDRIISNFDIYVIFSEYVWISGQNALGTASTITYSNGTAQNSTITLAVRSEYVSLTINDVQNIASHEIGHSLGLGHSNSSADLMYPAYDLFSTDNAISTLNLYGVALIFDWISTSDFKSPGQLRGSVTLPSYIEFEYAPIPEPAPKSINDNPIVKFLEMTMQIVLNPFVLPIVIVTGVLFAIMGIYYKKDGRRGHRHR